MAIASSAAGKRLRTETAFSRAVAARVSHPISTRTRSCCDQCTARFTSA